MNSASFFSLQSLLRRNRERGGGGGGGKRKPVRHKRRPSVNMVLRRVKGLKFSLSREWNSKMRKRQTRKVGTIKIDGHDDEGGDGEEDHRNHSLDEQKISPTPFFGAAKD